MQVRRRKYRLPNPLNHPVLLWVRRAKQMLARKRRLALAKG